MGCWYRLAAKTVAMVGTALTGNALAGELAGSSVIRVTEAPANVAVIAVQPPSTPAVALSGVGVALGLPVDITRPRRPSWAPPRPPAPGETMVGLPGTMPSRLPLAGRLTSGFGMRQHPLLGGRRAHGGVDLAAPTGTPIIAPSDGVVSRADWRGGYGLSVSLEHGGGIETRYGHMSRVKVAPGQRVRQGEVIGFVGSTGRSTGPHLHYELRVAGQPVNPLPSR